MNILAGYSSSIIQDFESYFKTEVHLVEADIRLALDKSNSTFNTSELLSGMYTFKDLSEVLLRNVQLEPKGVDNAIDSEIDDVSMKFKLVERSDIIAIKFNEKSFFIVF